MSLPAGIAVLCAEVLLVAGLLASPIGRWLAVVISAVLLPLPVIASTSPVGRFLLACMMAVPFLRACDLALRPTVPGFWQRVARLCTVYDVDKASWRVRRIEYIALTEFVVSVALLTTSLAVAVSLPASGAQLAVRWLAGGIVLFAAAELISACEKIVGGIAGVRLPPLFVQPYHSVSLAEFWSRRWNLPASEMFYRFCFRPLKRRSVGLAVAAAFGLSALGHFWLADVAIGRAAAWSCAAFFLLQPFFIALERRMNVKRWRTAAARVWTLGILAVTSPLVIEPLLRIVEKTWGRYQGVAGPVAAMVGFAIILSVSGALAAVGRPELTRTTGTCSW